MGMLEALKAEKNLRRIFGRRELVIVEKQLMGVTLSASEKTRLSRDIRKKLGAVAALMPFAREFRLKHGAVLKERIAESKEVIVQSPYSQRIKRIVLFGSAVTHQLTLGSDIDVAVEFLSINKREAFRFRLDMLKRVTEGVDVQVYNLLPEKIKKEIDAQGKLLYERTDKG